MAIDELSEEEQTEVEKMYRHLGPADMKAIAIAAKWGPREIDEMIFNLKEVRCFFEDIEHTTNNNSIRRRIKMIDEMIELLRRQRDNTEETTFY